MKYEINHAFEWEFSREELLKVESFFILYPESEIFLYLLEVDKDGKTSYTHKHVTHFGIDKGVRVDEDGRKEYLAAMTKTIILRTIK